MQEPCRICDDSDPIYNGICPECYLNGFSILPEIDGVGPDELFSNIQRAGSENTDIEYYNNLILLKRMLLEKFSQELSYNSRLQSKCQCGKIYDRHLCFDQEPHTLICEDCGPFCSNCYRDIHPNVTCKQYQKMVKIYESDFVQNWMMRFAKEKRASEHKESYNKNLSFLKQEVLKDCPYKYYDSAKFYEDSVFGSNNPKNLTTKYTKEEWHKVACQSEPMSKLHCNDVYCGKHHPERKKNTDGKNIHGCGRRIDWNYWVPVKIEEELCNKITDSDITDVTHLNYCKSPYCCAICKEKTRKAYATCQCSKCQYYDEKICISCAFSDGRTIIEKKIIIHWKKGFIEKDFILEYNDKYDYYEGYVPHIYGYSINDVTKVYVYRHPYYSTVSTCNIPQGRNKITRYGYFKSTDTVDLKSIDELFKHKIQYIVCGSNSALPVTMTQSKRFMCIRDGHLMKFSHLPIIKKHLGNIEKFKEKRIKIAKIIDFIKFYKRVNTWLKYIKIAKNLNSSATKINTMIKKYYITLKKKQNLAATKINRLAKSYYNFNNFTTQIIVNVISAKYNFNEIHITDKKQIFQTKIEINRRLKDFAFNIIKEFGSFIDFD